MMLLSPLVMAGVFGALLFKGQQNFPDWSRPLIAIGAMFVVLFGILQLMSNQFGFDRDGFRVFVLCAASRRDILLGKNLAFAPFALGMALVLLIAVQVLLPMRIDHFLGVIAQMVPMFLVFCLIGNLLSIIAPMPTAAGSMKPVKPKAATILIHMAFVFLFPLALAPTLIPLGIEALLSWSESLSWFPAYLVLAILECAFVVWLYPQVLASQGELLQRRERRILEIVTTKAE